jgi:hypothetical protein
MNIARIHPNIGDYKFAYSTTYTTGPTPPSQSSTNISVLGGQQEVPGYNSQPVEPRASASASPSYEIPVHYYTQQANSSARSMSESNVAAATDRHSPNGEAYGGEQKADGRYSEGPSKQQLAHGAVMPVAAHKAATYDIFHLPPITMQVFLKV